MHLKGNCCIRLALIYPASAILRLSSALRSQMSCNVVQVAVWACIAASSLSTILLALDRLLYFRAPHFYRALTKTAVIATALVLSIFCAG